MSRLAPVWRVVVQVPVADLPALREAILAVDSLAAGGYDQGMFEEAAGTEQFRPLPDTRPALGRPGRRERVPSVRLGFYLPRDPQRLQRLVEEAILPRHPWRSPVIEVSEVSLWLPAAPDGEG